MATDDRPSADDRREASRPSPSSSAIWYRETTSAGRSGYADPAVVSAGASGVVTKLPAEGSIVVRGKTLAEINERAVRLLHGATPMWRRLEKGVADGADVEQLERNLLELGFDPSGMDVDDHFDGATANAVKAWQDALGVAETGVVEQGDVVFLPGPRRVGQLSTARRCLGAARSGAAHDDGDRPVVDYRPCATDQELAELGAKVSVELPSGRVVSGTITDDRAGGRDDDRRPGRDR